MSDFQLGGWIGVAYAVVLAVISIQKNQRICSEQIGFTVGAVLTCQNIIPPVRFVILTLTQDHFLTGPLIGQEKYLLVAGVASGMATAVTLYSLWVQARKEIPKS